MMTKAKGTEEYRKGFECPLCRYMVSRRADLKKHLMKIHQLSDSEALDHQRQAREAYEKLTSVRYYPPVEDRYTKNLPGGE